ncbi:hypothetical protein VNI00_007745 [Paramarasmius palmivorus]|uniref:AB hydrolase-1 domain-containing protein n=1 Tax=Paramarasmius palmivorus TaxID=297713 RepID=A0AAW0D665_9AGAR
MRVLRLSATFLLLVTGVFGSKPSGFNPRDFQKRSVSCKAAKRNTGDEIVDIDLSYVDINPDAEKTLILVHGWPSLWSTWSYQIQEFKEEYRLIVPDLRGFGDSTHPDDVESSGTMFDHVGDLICILEDAKVDKAICIGHDWGSAICYEAGRSRPDIFEAIVGIAVPYIPAAGDFVPIKHLVSALPKLAYQLFFSGKTQEAIAELDKDIKRTIRATLRTGASPPPASFLTSPDSFLDAWRDVEEIPPVPFFSQEEEEYFIEEYNKQGFRNTLQFYTDSNRHATWKFANDQGNHTIPQPVLAILPKDMLEGGHWVHLEYPQEVNLALKRWLDKLDSKTETDTPSPKAEERHVPDEL